MAGVQVHDLYEKYPDAKVAVDDEQALLKEYDTIVLQHPLYWYSCPSLLKEWLDQVWVRGYAYGRRGGALEGKKLISVVSAGAPEATYQPEESNSYAVKDFLRTFEVTAKFCSMTYEEPLVLHNTYRVSEPEVIEHLKRYKELLASHVSL